jgi:type VI secretion system protein ImpG
VLSRDYQRELAYFRELAELFSKEYPGLAGMLAGRSGDPDVERLLEGVALLTCNIHARLDDAIPELIHGLTELLIPQYLRAVPACSIVQFEPRDGAQRFVSIPRGTQVGATKLERTSCLFRTTAAMELHPLTLLETTLQESSTAPSLRLAFQPRGRAEPFQSDSLRFFIHGEPGVSSMLLLWLMRHCREVQVRAPSGASVRLGPRALHPLGFDRAFPLLPWPEHAPEGIRLLQEYFTLPQKLLFFEVRGLRAAASVLREERFELLFGFNQPPPLPTRPGRDVFRLHCAPVVNLFTAPAAPIRYKALDKEHPLRADGVEHMDVYSVDKVTGLSPGRDERRVYAPFHSFLHASGRAGATSSFYRLRRALSPRDGGLDTFLSVGTPLDAPVPAEQEEVLSIELTCTNRQLPRRLQPGDIRVPTPTSPEKVSFTNITEVSPPLLPPLGAELHWRLQSHLALNQSSLTRPEVLRELLALYNFQGLSGIPADANDRRVAAVGGVSSRPTTRLMRGAPVRGAETTVELDESRFTGLGDAFLLGGVLDELMASNVTLNAFNELHVRLQPSRRVYQWQARSGFQPIL